MQCEEEGGIDALLQLPFEPDCAYSPLAALELPECTFEGCEPFDLGLLQDVVLDDISGPPLGSDAPPCGKIQDTVPSVPLQSEQDQRKDIASLVTNEETTSKGYTTLPGSGRSETGEHPELTLPDDVDPTVPCHHIALEASQKALASCQQLLYELQASIDQVEQRITLNHQLKVQIRRHMQRKRLMVLNMSCRGSRIPIQWTRRAAEHRPSAGIFSQKTGCPLPFPPPNEDGMELAQLPCPYRPWTAEEYDKLWRTVSAEGINMVRQERILRSQVADFLEDVCQEEQENMIKRFTSDNWATVAKHMPGRSPTECAICWHNYVDPSLNKTDWTTLEDQQLRRLVKKHGERDWATIARELGTNRAPFACLVHYTRDLEILLQRVKLAPEKQELFLRLVDAFAPNWKAVAMHMSTDSNPITSSQCLYLWQYRCYNHTLNQQPWTAPEDIIFQLAMLAHGPGKWMEASQHLPLRSPVQCQVRSRHFQKSEEMIWTEEYDAMLRMSVKEHGYRWGYLAQLFPGLTERHCKQRWLAIATLSEIRHYKSYRHQKKLRPYAMQLRNRARSLVISGSPALPMTCTPLLTDIKFTKFMLVHSLRSVRMPRAFIQGFFLEQPRFLTAFMAIMLSILRGHVQGYTNGHSAATLGQLTAPCVQSIESGDMGCRTNKPDSTTSMRSNCVHCSACIIPPANNALSLEATDMIQPNHSPNSLGVASSSNEAGISAPLDSTPPMTFDASKALEVLQEVQRLQQSYRKTLQLAIQCTNSQPKEESKFQCPAIKADKGLPALSCSHASHRALYKIWHLLNSDVSKCPAEVAPWNQAPVANGFIFPFAMGCSGCAAQMSPDELQTPAAGPMSSTEACGRTSQAGNAAEEHHNNAGVGDNEPTSIPSADWQRSFRYALKTLSRTCNDDIQSTRQAQATLLHQVTVASRPKQRRPTKRQKQQSSGETLRFDDGHRKAHSITDPLVQQFYKAQVTTMLDLNELIVLDGFVWLQDVVNSLFGHSVLSLTAQVLAEFPHMMPHSSCLLLYPKDNGQCGSVALRSCGVSACEVTTSGQPNSEIDLMVRRDAVQLLQINHCEAAVLAGAKELIQLDQMQLQYQGQLHLVQTPEEHVALETKFKEAALRRLQLFASGGRQRHRQMTEEFDTLGAASDAMLATEMEYHRPKRNSPFPVWDGASAKRRKKA